MEYPNLEGAASKKRAKRADIPRESVKRLIKQGARGTLKISGSQSCRVSRKAAESTQKVATSLVEELSEECRKYMKGHRAKTVTDETLAYVVGVVKGRGLDTKMIQASEPSRTKSGLSLAGRVRIFKRTDEVRISASANS